MRDDDDTGTSTVCPIILRISRKIGQVGAMDQKLVGKCFDLSKCKILV